MAFHFTLPATTVPRFSKERFPQSTTANEHREAGTGVEGNGER